MKPNFPPRGLTKGSLVRIKARYVIPPDVFSAPDNPDDDTEIGIVVDNPRLETRFKTDFLDHCVRNDLEVEPSRYVYMIKVHWPASNATSWHNVQDLDVLSISRVLTR